MAIKPQNDPYRMVVFTVEQIDANRATFVFCTIPRWARFGLVNHLGEVVQWKRHCLPGEPACSEDGLAFFMRARRIAKTLQNA